MLMKVPGSPWLPEVGVRLAGALGAFWDTGGHVSEGRAWLARALAQSQPIAPAIRAKALNQAGRLAWSQDDTSTARELFEESLGLFRTLDLQDEAANVLYNLGQMALGHGDLKLAAELLDEALTLHRLLGDRRGIAWTLKALGDIARFQDEYARATALVHEALVLFESFRDLGSIAHCKWTLGHIARSEGDDIVAAARYGEALVLAQAVGDRLLIASIHHNQAFLALHRHDDSLAEALLRDSLAISREIEAKGQIAWDLAAFGGIAAMRGQSERATRLLGAVEAWFESTGNYIGPTERAEHDRYLAAARAQASGEMFAQALASGRAMSLEQALAWTIGDYNH